MTISTIINRVFGDFGSLWDIGKTRTPSPYEGMELQDTWQWMESRRDVSPELTEKVLAGLDKPWAFVGPGGSGSGLLPAPAPIAGSDEFYESLGRASSATEVPADALARMHGRRDKWWADEDESEEEEPDDKESKDKASFDELDETSTTYDQRTFTENTYVTEEGDVTNITYQYDPNESQDIEKASNDGLFGSSGLFGMMMLMMMLMPMMQGFGGMPQVIRAEPAQSDISGLFYG